MDVEGAAVAAACSVDDYLEAVAAFVVEVDAVGSLTVDDEYSDDVMIVAAALDVEDD